MAKKNMSLTKVPMPEQAPDVRNKNFEEVALGYTAEMAMEEAARCLNCKNKPCVSGCPVCDCEFEYDSSETVIILNKKNSDYSYFKVVICPVYSGRYLKISNQSERQSGYGLFLAKTGKVFV